MPELDTAALWRHWHDEMWAYLRSRVDSEASAQDILQTAFLRAHESLARGDLPEHPRAWLYRIVRNLVADAHRQARRQQVLGQAAAHEPPPESKRRVDEETAAVVARTLPRFVRALPAPYRDAVSMTELEGLTMAEAAGRAGVSLSGMKSRVQRGRKQLFDALQRCCQLELDGRGRVITCTSRATGNDCC